jgi:hypothetical protein
MATIELKMYYMTISTPKKEVSFYKIDGINGKGKSSTPNGLEKIFNEFAKEKKGFSIEVYNQIPVIENSLVEKVVMRPDEKGCREVYRVLRPEEIPESIAPYLKKAI